VNNRAHDRRELAWDRAAGWLDDAAAAADAGRLDDALALARRAARTLDRAVGKRHPDAVNAQLTVGRILQAQGQPRRALPHLARAATTLAVTRRDPPIVVELAVQGQLARARCLQELGRFDDARGHARTALGLARRRLGERAEATLWAHNLLGMIGKFSGRFAEAERHYRAALPIARKRYGPVSRELATLLHNLGGLEHARGNFAKGEPPARRSVEIARALMKPTDPERVAHEVAHAALLDGLGRHAEAIAIYRRAVAAFTRYYGRAHYEVASTLHNLGSAEHSLGRVAAARRHYEESIALMARVRGPTHPDLALTRYNLAILLRDAGQVAAARRLLRRALATFRARLGPGHPNTRACVADLAALG
jgi:tetratricopeptide (TPR) repeat protein